jgi:hypothetical protein
LGACVGLAKRSATVMMRCIDFEQLRLLSANTLDNRRNCRHNHMLDVIMPPWFAILIARFASGERLRPGERADYRYWFGVLFLFPAEVGHKTLKKSEIWSTLN